LGGGFEALNSQSVTFDGLDSIFQNTPIIIQKEGKIPYSQQDSFENTFMP
jgi:hypothetical protein